MEQKIEPEFILLSNDNRSLIEHSRSIKSLQKDIVEIAEMFSTLNEVVTQQEQSINILSDQITSAQINTEQANIELSASKQYNDNYHYYFAFGGGLVLTLIGGPSLLGIKATCMVASGVVATALGINYLNK